MEDLLAAVFWSSLGLIFYSYVLYPLGVCFAACLSRRTGQVSEVEDLELPSVTVVISAHNAELHIRRRIENLLACDYPSAKLKILIGSDGSSDSTVAEAISVRDARVSVVEFAERRGKAATLCDLVDHAASEVVLFTDASTHFDVAAIRRLAARFLDPELGVAIGNVSIFNENGERTEGFYWRLETRLRRAEAKLGIVLGASGAIYAIRRGCFVAPRFPVVNDDLVIPMLSKLTSRCGCVFEPAAQAFAVVPKGLAVEYRRRARIGAGAFPSLAAVTPLLAPANWQHAFAFASHKVLRWICPLLLILLLASNLALAAVGGTTYQIALAAQLLGYGFAFVGAMIPARGFTGRITRLAASFCVMNLAILVGLSRWLRGANSLTWKPTARPASGYALLPPTIPHPKMNESGATLLQQRAG